MPIAFPPSNKCKVLTDAATCFKRVAGIQAAPNRARPGAKFGEDHLNPGLCRPRVAQNVRRLGTTYADVAQTAIVNPVNTRLTDLRVFDRRQGIVRWEISGVSRDGTGAALAFCRVMAFHTVDNSFLAETTSDAAGAWTLRLDRWPLFLVEYRAGAPDKSGTSLNTLVPTAIP